MDDSEWESPIVYVKKKNNEIRACTDFSMGLNDCLETYYYPLPSPKDIFVKLNGGKVFSKVDLFEAYLQIPVEKNVLNYKDVKGLYRFNMLPFGIKTTSGIHQPIMDVIE